MLGTMLNMAVTGYKTYCVFSSGVQIYATVNNPNLNNWQKTHNVALNTVYMLSQTTALHTDGFNANVASSIFSAGKNISNKSLEGTLTKEDILKNIFFEIGMLNGSTKILRPIVDNIPFVQLTDEAASALCFMASDYKSMKDVPDHIQNIWKNKTAIWNWFINKKIPHKVRIDPTGQTVFIIPRSHYEQRKKVQELEGIEGLREIPDYFSGTTIYSYYECPITKTNIRHLVAVKGTQDNDHPVFYEKRAVEQWIADHPTKKPARWPDSIRYHLSNLIPANSHQTMINSQLKKDLEEIKMIRFEPDSEEVSEPPRQRQKTGERS